MHVKMTFTIPEETAENLKEMVVQRKRSAFVADALSEKFQEIEQEEFKQQLIRDYIERYEEDRLINKEWEAATLEGWLDY